MTISITLPAGNIPDGTEVFKVNGVKPYTLKTGIRLFTQGEKSKVITPAPDTVYLVSVPDADINQVHGDTPLRVDFPDADEAITFLQDMQAQEEDDK
jgi:hypothetical protein